MSSEKKLDVVTFDKIPMRAIEWLWPNRIPLGKVTIFAGLPGEGKGLTWVNIAASVTTAASYPDSPNPLPPSDALILSSEDDSDDAVKPRLVAAGADVSRCTELRGVVVSGDTTTEWNLDSNLHELAKYLTEHPSTRLVVVDPASNHLAATKMNNEQELRRVLLALGRLARKFSVAFICVIHLNKKEDLTAVLRVSGAGFVGAARASWLFCRDKDEESRHLMLPIKCNYMPEGTPGLSFRIEAAPVTIDEKNVSTPRIVWTGNSEVLANDALNRDEEKTAKLEAAKAFLLTFGLDRKSIPATTIEAHASTQRISIKTLRRAKRELGIRSDKDPAHNGRWLWTLMPESPVESSPGKAVTLGSPVESVQ